MKNKYFLLSLLVALLSACGGGGSSSSSSSNNNFTQLTPNGGLQATTPSALQANQLPNSYLAFGNNGQNIYSSIGNSGLFQINANYNGWNNLEINTQVNNLPLVVISGNDNGVYYVPINSNQAYNTSGNGFTNGVDSGYITAITASNNGSTYYGTSVGGVGLVNNPADKTIPSINGFNSDNGPILSVGCENASCNSGQQGVLAFQAESLIVPSFESSNYTSSYSYVTKMYYLNHGSWIDVSGFRLDSSTNVTINNVTYPNVPEFITSVAINSTNSTLYVGTNLFNIYAASLNCNNGQGCNVNWNTATVNNVPLGIVSNGSQGIVSLSVLNGNKLLVVANTSESVTNIYVQN